MPELISIEVPPLVTLNYALGEGPVSMLINEGFEPSLAVCGPVVVEPNFDNTDEITFSKELSTLAVKADENSSVADIEEVSFSSYLRDFPVIEGKPFKVIVLFTGCNPGAVSPSYIPDIEYLNGSKSKIIKLPEF